MDVLDALAGVKIFGGLDRGKLKEIASHCREEEFGEGAIIFDESEKGEDLYALAEGRVSVEMRVPPRLERTVRLTTLGQGEVLGEVSFIRGTGRTALVRAVNKVRVLVLDGKGLHRLLEEDRDLGYVVMKNLAELLCRRLEDTSLMWRNAVMAESDSP